MKHRFLTLGIRFRLVIKETVSLVRHIIKKEPWFLVKGKLNMVLISWKARNET